MVVEIVPIPEVGLAIPPSEIYLGQWSHSKTWAGMCPWEGDGVKVGVLDTGCNIMHPALMGNVVDWYNQVDGTKEVQDLVGHGTRVAGMVAGETAVATRAKLVPIKVSNSSDGSADTRVIAAGIMTALGLGCSVVNISYDVSSSDVVKHAAQEFADQGGVTVIAAGNSGTSHSHPQDSNMIAVGATNKYDNKPSWTETGIHVDIYAPGVSVFTTSAAGDYAIVSGTSFSSPFVAGLCAIIKQIRPEYSISEVFGCLRRWLNRAERVNAARAAYAAWINLPLL